MWFGNIIRRGALLPRNGQVVYTTGKPLYCIQRSEDPKIIPSPASFQHQYQHQIFGWPALPYSESRVFNGLPWLLEGRWDSKAIAKSERSLVPCFFRTRKWCMSPCIVFGQKSFSTHPAHDNPTAISLLHISIRRALHHNLMSSSSQSMTDCCVKTDCCVSTDRTDC